MKPLRLLSWLRYRINNSNKVSGHLDESILVNDGSPQLSDAFNFSDISQGYPASQFMKID